MELYSGIYLSVGISCCILFSMLTKKMSLSSLRLSSRDSHLRSSSDAPGSSGLVIIGDKTRSSTLYLLQGLDIGLCMGVPVR